MTIWILHVKISQQTVGGTTMCFLFHALSLYHGKSDYITPVYGE